MTRLLVRGLELAGVLFVLGWALVLASGHGGNAVGGSVLVWRLGGLAVYASVGLVAVIAILAVAAGLRSIARRRSPGA